MLRTMNIICSVDSQESHMWIYSGSCYFIINFLLIRNTWYFTRILIIIHCINFEYCADIHYSALDINFVILRFFWILLFWYVYFSFPICALYPIQIFSCRFSFIYLFLCYTQRHLILPKLTDTIWPS